MKINKKKPNRLKQTLMSILLATTLAFNSCTTQKTPASIQSRPKINLPKISIKQSFTTTFEGYLRNFQNASDYFEIYQEEFNGEYEKEKRRLKTLEQKIRVDNLMNYRFLTTRRDSLLDLEAQDSLGKFIANLGKDSLKDSFNKFDVVIEIQQGLKSRFFPQKQKNQTPSKQKTQSYISKLTHASQIDLGIKPEIYSGNFDLRTYAKLTDFHLLGLGINQGKIEFGTDIFRIRLGKLLQNNWLAYFTYGVENFNTKKTDLSLYKSYGENTGLSITIGYGEENIIQTPTKEYFIGINLIKGF